MTQFMPTWYCTNSIKIDQKMRVVVENKVVPFLMKHGVESATELCEDIRDCDS